MSHDRFATLRSAATDLLGGRLFPFLTCVAIGFLIAFARNPDPYFQRVLFAEDGNDYYTGIQADGFWTTVREARTDYYVFGNVAVAWLGIRACDLFAGGDLFVVPAYMACASYLFFATAAALPVLLLRGRIPLGWLLALAVLTAFLPMDGQDNEILGRALNTGYSWLSIAFLAVIRRDELVRLPSRTRWQLVEIAGLDLLLVASVATNPIVLVLLPAVFVAYWKPFALEPLDYRRSLFRWDFSTAVAMAMACLPVVVRILTKERQHLEPPGEATLDRVIELMVARGLMFPIVHPFYTSLSTPIVLGLLGLVVTLFLALGRRRNREIYLVGGFALAVSVAALGIMRSELFNFCHGYRDTFPIRYVQGQYAIALTLLTALAWDIASNRALPKLIRALPIFLAVVSCIDIPRQSSFGAPVFQFVQFGDIADHVALATTQRQFCDREGRPDPNGPWLRIRSYPAYDAETGLPVLVNRNDAEKALLKRADHRQDFHEAIATIRQIPTRQPTPKTAEVSTPDRVRR